MASNTAVHVRNRALRFEYLAACLDYQTALATDDQPAAESARARASAVANTFMAENARLAYKHIRPLLSTSAAEDVAAAATLGLWEAFAGTDPEGVMSVKVDEDGVPHPAQGWDPDSGTFATWCKQHVYGKARRAVAATEAPYQGISYSGFQLLPSLKKAIEAHAAAGRSATPAQLATELGVSKSMVESLMLAGHVSSLDAPSRESERTLGEVIADDAQFAVSHEEDSDVALRLLLDSELTGAQFVGVGALLGAFGPSPMSVAASAAVSGQSVSTLNASYAGFKSQLASRYAHVSV